MLCHRSPGLTAIFNELKKSKHNRVLDLGPMSAANFSFFSQLSCKIHFENLDEFIVEHGSLSASNQIYHLERYLLEHKEEEKFDVILSWDLFNYLELEAIEALLNKLKKYCKPNTLLHMIKYMKSEIPAIPRKFNINDSRFVNLSEEAHSLRRIPQHNTAQLLKKIPQYFMHNTLVNLEGMQPGLAEHVLRYMPEKASRKQHVAYAEITQTANEIDNKKLVKHKSPSIQNVLDLLSEKKNGSILDLGMKSATNMDYWQKHGTHAYAEDVMSSIRWWRHENQAKMASKTLSATVPAVSPQLLKFDSNTTFDAIIAWDIFNYCSHNQLRAIGERLSPHCNKDTILVVFMYSGDQMPAKPQKFKLTSDSELYSLTIEKKVRVKNAVTSSSLMKLLSGFGIKQTFIFRPGMLPGVSEWAFEYRGARSGHSALNVKRG